MAGAGEPLSPGVERRPWGEALRGPNLVRAKAGQYLQPEPDSSPRRRREVNRGSERSRAPSRPRSINAIAELKTIAKGSAQPAVKGAAIVAATGGLVASFAGTANAADGTSSVTAPAAVGPQVGTPAAGNALSSIGYAAPALKQAQVKPLVIEDIQVKTERAAQQKAADQLAAAKAAKQAAADQAAAAQAAAAR